jgi:hypothetical protein
MKYLSVLLLTSVIAFTNHAMASIEAGSIESAILKQFESLVDASKKRDKEGYFAHFDEEKFIGLNSDGTNWNSLNDLKPLVETGFDMIARINSLDFTNVKISVIDANTAILVNEFNQEMVLTSGETVVVSGGGTQVWSKTSGSWKLVSVSASDKPIQHH